MYVRTIGTVCRPLKQLWFFSKIDISKILQIFRNLGICAWCPHILIGVLGGRVFPGDPFRQQLGVPGSSSRIWGFWKFWTFLKILKISDFWKFFEFLIFWNLKKNLKKFLCHVDDHHVCKYFIINILYDIQNIISINYTLIVWSYMKIYTCKDVCTPKYGLGSKGLSVVKT